MGESRSWIGLRASVEGAIRSLGDRIDELRKKTNKSKASRIRDLCSTLYLDNDQY